MEIVIRATIIFFFLWLMTRALGKREVSEVTAFELLVLVVMGDLVQQGVTQEDMSIIGAMLAVGTFGVWVLLFSWLEFRFPRTRKLLAGQPQIIVRDGEPLLEVLKLERVTIEEVLEAAREQGITDLDEVSVGILETDGKFAFLRKDGKQPEQSDEKTKA